MRYRSTSAAFAIGLLLGSCACPSAFAGSGIDSVSCESKVLHQQLDAAIARMDQSPIREYDSTFPWTVSVCAGSRESDRQEQSPNPFGHVALFLKGVCRDKSAATPRVKVCPNSDPSDPDQGVGVSVDDDFRNANWVAVEGRQMFLYGDTPNSDLGDVVSPREIQKASAYYKGIELTPQAMAKKTRGETTAYYAAAYGVGTDFALNRARQEVDCAQIPVTRASMSQLVDYLNGINRHYAKTKDYSYSIVTDNCAHLVRRALVAGGIFPQSDLSWDAPSSLPAPGSPAAFAATALVARATNALAVYKNGAAPADEMMLLLKRSSNAKPLRPEQVYRDPALRRQLEKDRGIPIEMPVTFTTYLRAPGLQDFSHRGDRGVDSPTLVFSRQQATLNDYFPLKHLQAARDKFVKMAQHRAAAEAYASRTSNPSDYRRFLSEYYGWVDSSLAKLNRQLALFDQLQSQLSENLKGAPDPLVVCGRNPAGPVNTTDVLKSVDSAGSGPGLLPARSRSGAMQR